MSSVRQRVPGVAELRAVWIAAGLLALVLHVPLTLGITLAIVLPWAAGMAILARAERAASVVGALRGALASRAGPFGLAGLLFVAITLAIVIAPGAGMLFVILLAAGGIAVGAFRGADVLREQIAGWAMLALTTLFALGVGEAVLRVPSVAARIGTPREIDAWWQRYDGLWDTNLLSIRSRYETLRKEPGVLRVVALGDSFTWGDKIARADSTWPALLEDRLEERVAAPVEVVNLGQKGFTTVNEAEMLRRLGWQFEPDVVVVQFYLNDILPSGPDFERGYSGWIFPRAWLLPERYKRGHAGRSALLYVAESVVTGWRHGDRAAQARKWTEVYTRRGPEWDDLAGALVEMGEAARARGVPIVFMLFPDFIPGMSDAADHPLHAIHAQVIDVARDAGYTVLDLTPAFVQANPDMTSWWATPYDAHPNEAAAALAAERLAEHLTGVIGDR